MIKHSYVTDSAVQRLFDDLQRQAHVKWTKLLIVKRHKINAMTNMVTHRIRITTLDLKLMHHDDLEALLGHELGHLHAEEQPTYWLYYALVFVGIMFLSYFNVDFTVYNQIIDSLLNLFQTVIDVLILLFIMSFYSRPAETKADQFSARLVGKAKIIHLLTMIHDYHLKEIQESEAMTAELKTVPTAYLECQAWLHWHRLLLWINQHNFGIHPSFTKRIQSLKDIKK